MTLDSSGSVDEAKLKKLAAIKARLQATAGAAATLSGRGDAPTRFPAETRLATAVRARTVRAERPEQVFQRVTSDFGETFSSAKA